MAIPNLEPIIGRKGATMVEMLSRVIPLLGAPFMVNRFHANGGLKETNNKVVASSWRSLTGPLAARMRPLSASTNWHPDETRFSQTVTSRGCSSEALSRIRQLRLLNSNNTCHLNAFVLSWLHAITQSGCTEYAAFRCRSQAWRDVLYSGKPFSHPGEVFLRAGQMFIVSMMQEKCLSTGLPQIGARW